MSAEELTVLVVDDDYRVAAVHQGFVERVPGFRVVGQAHTAQQARELAAELHPDLVLMDVYLPDGDGLEVMRGLLDDAEPPIALVISAAGDLDSVRTALRLGAAHYLVKPFGFAALAERLTAIRDAQTALRDWPDEPTQEDVDRLYSAFRPGASLPHDDGLANLAPTLRLVLEALAREDGGLSASEVAQRIGISRATAQRCLAQLEQSRMVQLQLRYGSTGRPEHRYSIRRR